MKSFSIRESLAFGWETFKKQPWVIMGGFVLAMLVSGISSAILTPSDGGPGGLAGFFMFIASVVISTFVEMGLVTFALKAHDAVEEVKIRDLWNPKPFWYYLAAQIIAGVAVVIGFLLLIIPGVILALGLLFTSYLIIDKGRGPIEALKESWRITKGYRSRLFLLVLAMCGINIIGALLLFVGLLVTIPLTMLALAHTYRTLEHAASEMTPVPTA